jgi:hypothetical protein
MERLKQHDPRAQRANALYWESQLSVNQIADEMDLSKGMLYGLIQPSCAELLCPLCSSEMGYANRTARERGFLRCPSCDFEQDEDQVRSKLQDAAPADSDDRLLITSGLADPYTSRHAPHLRRPRGPLLLGVGILIVAAGIWIFRGLPRR